MVNLHCLGVYKFYRKIMKNSKITSAELRNKAIIFDYKTLIKVKGSQKMAIYEKLSLKWNISKPSISRIVNK